ncbi:MAG: hypothetical protein J3K34DRAFT_526323 [Monoraphidium minutum]|nr:MAG: hypothetical protein J3K34DRAFT_526323 [Monoraphidium minutum]
MADDEDHAFGMQTALDTARGLNDKVRLALGALRVQGVRAAAPQHLEPDLEALDAIRSKLQQVEDLLEECCTLGPAQGQQQAQVLCSVDQARGDLIATCRQCSKFVMHCQGVVSDVLAFCEVGPGEDITPREFTTCWDAAAASAAGRHPGFAPEPVYGTIAANASAALLAGTPTAAGAAGAEEATSMPPAKAPTSLAARRAAAVSLRTSRQQPAEQPGSARVAARGGGGGGAGALRSSLLRAAAGPGGGAATAPVARERRHERAGGLGGEGGGTAAGAQRQQEPEQEQEEQEQQRRHHQPDLGSGGLRGGRHHGRAARRDQGDGPAHPYASASGTPTRPPLGGGSPVGASYGAHGGGGGGSAHGSPLQRRQPALNLSRAAPAGAGDYGHGAGRAHAPAADDGRGARAPGVGDSSQFGGKVSLRRFARGQGEGSEDSGAPHESRALKVVHYADLPRRERDTDGAGDAGRSDDSRVYVSAQVADPPRMRVLQDAVTMSREDLARLEKRGRRHGWMARAAKLLAGVAAAAALGAAAVVTVRAVVDDYGAVGAGACSSDDGRLEPLAPRLPGLGGGKRRRGKGGGGAVMQRPQMPFAPVFPAPNPLDSRG